MTAESLVIDSSALIAILRREPEADPFLTAIASAPTNLLAAVNLLATSMVLATHTGDAGSARRLSRSARIPRPDPAR